MALSVINPILILRLDRAYAVITTTKEKTVRSDQVFGNWREREEAVISPEASASVTWEISIFTNAAEMAGLLPAAPPPEGIINVGTALGASSLHHLEEFM